VSRGQPRYRLDALINTIATCRFLRDASNLIDAIGWALKLIVPAHVPYISVHTME
jgi:hypothetical protein